MQPPFRGFKARQVPPRAQAIFLSGNSSIYSAWFVSTVTFASLLQHGFGTGLPTRRLGRGIHFGIRPLDSMGSHQANTTESKSPPINVHLHVMGRDRGQHRHCDHWMALLEWESWTNVCIGLVVLRKIYILSKSFRLPVLFFILFSWVFEIQLLMQVSITPRKCLFQVMTC